MRALRLRIARIAALAAAAWIAAGCDYWRNLVEEKTVTKVLLTLTVRDAWTREPIFDAECADSLRGVKANADDSGRILIPETNTGPYVFTCTAPSYYPSGKAFDMSAKETSVKVDMARRGLDEWYPEDISRQVKFPTPVDVIRYPPQFQVASLPKNSGSIFRYAWTLAHNQNLNQATTIAKAGTLNLVLSAKAKDILNPGPDVITVTVYSALRGPDSLYVVGGYTMPFTWERNKLPFWTVNRYQSDTLKVGCHTDPPLAFEFSAADSDGVAKGVHFFTLDSSSSLGAVDMVRSVFTQSIKFPLTDRAAADSVGTGFTMGNRLYVDVWDDNNDTLHDSIVFQSRSNVRPTAHMGFVDGQSAYFPRTDVKMWIEGGNADGSVYKMILDWGDGTVVDTVPEVIAHTVRDTLRHRYNTPGSRSPVLHVLDDCPSEAFAYLPVEDSIRIRANTKPKITLDTVGFDLKDTSLFQIKVSVLDQDVIDGFDSVEVLIDWGEGLPDTAAVTPARPDFMTKGHRYLAKPRDGGAYRLKVKATDSQKEFDQVNRLIPQYMP